MGKSGSGKTCLIHRWRFKEFDTIAPATIGASFACLTVDDAKIQIWDTAGNERYKSLTPMYLRGSHLVFYCVDSLDDFNPESHKVLIDDIIYQATNVQIIIIATKCDAKTIKVTNKKKIRGFAETINCDYIETSAKTGYNVDELFKISLEKLKSIELKQRETVLLDSPRRSRCCF
jgi:small GTP-binding protein